jgi:hypothetical protein
MSYAELGCIMSFYSAEVLKALGKTDEPVDGPAFRSRLSMMQHMNREESNLVTFYRVSTRLRSQVDI